MIKEINNTYPVDQFLTTPIKNYKVHASIYKLFEDHVTNKNKFDINEIIDSRNCITGHLCESAQRDVKKKTEDDELINIYMQQTEDVRMIGYKMLVNSMNEKYKSLDNSQKNILREYINNISNTNNLNTIIVKELNSIKSQLNIWKTKIDNEVVRIKVNEAINQLDKLTPDKGIKDNHIMAILLGYELIKEIKEKVS